MKFLTVVCLLLLIFSAFTSGSGKIVSGGLAPASTTTSPANKTTATVAEAVFNFAEFGAVGDGITDNGPALQAALNAIGAAGGGILFVPAGRYAISTPVQKNFAGLASSLTILGVASLTPAPPPNASPGDLTAGLGLVSEFAPRTGGQHIAIELSGLQNFLIKDITFIGTPDVNNDARVTLALSDIWEAAIKHCEFYGLSSLVAGGAIVQVVRSHFNLEQSVFLGCTGNSGVHNSVVQTVEWKSIRLADSVFVDYGQRAELYGKLGLAAPFSWLNIGNADAAENDSPRREVVLKNIFLDEGGLYGISSTPDLFQPASAPIDLIYVTGLYMNVSNLGTSGNYLRDPERVLIENSHYGFSHFADSAIDLVSVNNAILDRVECTASANRIHADAATAQLFVINSSYAVLDSQAPQTKVITTETPEADPVQFVRQQFQTILGREPDAAAHFYWSNRLLQCGADAPCAAAVRAAFTTYLSAAPAAIFSITGTVSDESGAGIPGATITLSGSQSVTAQTGADGQYSFDRLPTSGVYTLISSHANYTFNAPSQTITLPNGNQTVDFTATPKHYEISGHVSEGGVALGGVTISLSGTQSAVITTNAAGNYSFTVPATGSYTITPTKTDHFFSPASLTFNDLSDNQQANFQGTQQCFLEFSAAGYNVSEDARRAFVTVSRTGDTSSVAEVIYSAVDGSAQQRSDLIPVIGRLTFEPGESNKTFTVFVTDDSYVEGDEEVMLELSDPIGGSLGNSTAMLTIADNDTEATTANPIDEAQFFVSQQYRDFLNRVPDAEGLAFWSNQISSCGSDAACIADRRMNVSAAFFLSIEFQETGFLVYRLYRAAYGQPPEHLNEFLLDTRTIGEGVIVNAPGWEALLAANRTAFIEDFVQRPQFSERYPVALTPGEFVVQLNTGAGGALTGSQLAAAVAEFGGAATSENVVARAKVLRAVAESPVFSQHQLNPAFVLLQYFGYLQRNPDEAPDDNLDGYNFWLHKLEEFNGDFRGAEMVKSFLVSAEYRARFGAP
jgi:hypothetical protein